MKIAFLGDTHFGGGYSLGRTHPSKSVNTRLIDFFNTFDYVIDYLISNNIEHLIITGDIFEHRRPQSSQIKLFAKRLKTLINKNIKTHIIIGNHDMVLNQKSTTLDVFKALDLPNVFIYYNLESIQISDGNKSANFVFLPYKSRQILGVESNSKAVEVLSSRIKTLVSELEPADANILVGHMIVEGTSYIDDMSEYVGDIVIPQKALEDFNLVILGHVHPFHVIRKAKPTILYIGSMERKNFGEKNHPKHFGIIDLAKENTMEFIELPVRNLFDIEIIDEDAITANELQTTCFNALEGENLQDSILRLNIITTESAYKDLNLEDFRKLLYTKYKINYCSGIHIQVISKRQLRNSSINETADPKQSFKEFLDLMEQEDDFKDCLWREGVNIIDEVLDVANRTKND